jgi:hypothetical protein
MCADDELAVRNSSSIVIRGASKLLLQFGETAPMRNFLLLRAVHGGLAFAAVLLTMPLAGCSDGVPLHPVQGVVVWSDGEPVRELVGGGVSLQLIGQAERTTTPYGEIQADGTFSLRSPGFGDGVQEGNYSAIVMRVIKIDPLGPPPVPIMDRRFQDHRKSDLEVVVEPGDNQITLEVERAKSR